MTEIQDVDDIFEEIGREPTVTFGLSTIEGINDATEVVGPLKPKHVQHGHLQTKTHTKPLVFFNFNKYRSDLPPWRDVWEFVLAGQTDEGPSLYTFEGLVQPRGTQITADLKTVTLSAMYAWEGVEQCDIIDKHDVVTRVN